MNTHTITWEMESYVETHLFAKLRVFVLLPRGFYSVPVKRVKQKPGKTRPDSFLSARAGPTYHPAPPPPHSLRLPSY